MFKLSESYQIDRMISEGGRDLPESVKKREPLIVEVPTLLSMLHKAGLLPDNGNKPD